MVHCTWLHKVLGPLEFQWNALLITNQIPAILVQKADWRFQNRKKKGVFLEDIHVVVETGYGNQSFYHGNTEYATWFQVLFLSVHLFKFCLWDIFIINVLIEIEEKKSFNYFVFVVFFPFFLGGGGGYGGTCHKLLIIYNTKYPKIVIDQYESYLS